MNKEKGQGFVEYGLLLVVTVLAAYLFYYIIGSQFLEVPVWTPLGTYDINAPAPTATAMATPTVTPTMAVMTITPPAGRNIYPVAAAPTGYELILSNAGEFKCGETTFKLLTNSIEVDGVVISGKGWDFTDPDGKNQSFILEYVVEDDDDKESNLETSSGWISFEDVILAYTMSVPHMWAYKCK